MTLVGVLLLGIMVLQQRSPVYEDIPESFDFPANEANLLMYRDNKDTYNMRLHVWNIFRGLTQSSKSGIAIWETWYRGDEVFFPSQDSSPQTLRRRFQVPKQLAVPNKDGPFMMGRFLLSRNLYNRFAEEHIRANELHLAAKRDHLNELLEKAPGRDRTLAEALRRDNAQSGRTLPIDFDRRAVAVKTVWWPVRDDGYTAMPVWDEPKVKLRTTYPIETWSRVVAVTACQDVPEGQFREIVFAEKVHIARVVPITRLYSHRLLSDDDVEELSKSEFAANIGDILGRDARKGDYILLVALHITTKEIPNWTWATFWWHDRPDEGPYADGRPGALCGPWRNYLMNQTFHMDAKKGPLVCYNPWLEAQLTNGVSSNCMTCHQKAGWEKARVTPVLLGDGLTEQGLDSWFQTDAMQTGFLWSLGGLREEMDE